MSCKTLRPSPSSALLPTAERFALQRIHVACAVGLLVLAPITSFALELGEAAIRSGLGQSLRVEIPYRLAADERLTPACVGLVPAPRPDRELPTYTRVSRVTITPTHIEIVGDSRVLEPLIGLTVDVHCDTTPHFVRSYQLFVDPPARIPAILANGTQVAAATTTMTATSGSAPSTEAPRTPRATVSARARGQTGGTLTQGQTYIVVRGDTLSGIAARIGDRGATIRETAEAIFAANPAAFTRGNRDLIEAGHSITIPIMAAATATLPALPAAAPLPAVEASLANVPRMPSAAPSPAPVSEITPLRAATTAPVVVPEVIEPPAEPITVVQPSATPVPMPASITPEGASSATAGRASGWLTALLALGVVIVLSTPLLFLRRRKQEPALQDTAKPLSSHPLQPVDPVAGIDVVEGHDAVDLDVGEPSALDDRDDGFGHRVDTAAAADPAVAEATTENAVTAQMPELDSATHIGQPPLEPKIDVSDPTIDDQQHRLTIVELDILRKDYEAEYTLTQEASKALRDALLDLKATQAARAANGDTATLEMPQEPQTETIETQPTQRLRSSR